MVQYHANRSSSNTPATGSAAAAVGLRARCGPLGRVPPTVAALTAATARVRLPPLNG